MKVAKYVYYEEVDTRSGRKSVKPYRGLFNHKSIMYHCGNFETLREAQIAVDKKLLSLGLEPLMLKIRKKE